MYYLYISIDPRSIYHNQLLLYFIEFTFTSLLMFLLLHRISITFFYLTGSADALLALCNAGASVTAADKDGLTGEL